MNRKNMIIFDNCNVIFDDFHYLNYDKVKNIQEF